MAINNRIGTKVPKTYVRENTPGVRVDSGPYVGIVKNVIDPNRSGRIQVFIPDLGGVEDEPTHWRTVSYASPFFGTTHYPSRYPRKEENTFEQAEHSYGFWFVPPDIGNEVLITFVMGDPARGYWFACVVPSFTNHMVPAIAANPNQENPVGSNAPVTEFNISNKNRYPSPGTDVHSIKKPVHDPQYDVLLNQGLDRDTVRGTITSSAQRETPSKVFGFSTPGKHAGVKDVLTDSPFYRLGGHTFVMDDGDENGGSQLVRIRTAGGHQLMMHDTEGVVYLANSTGTVWLEFTNTGAVNLYCDSDLNIRARGDVNMHSDNDINIHAQNAIKMYAGSSIKQQTSSMSIKGTTDVTVFGGKMDVFSASSLNIQAAASGDFGVGANMTLSGSQIHLNTTTAQTAAQATDLTINSHTDVAKEGKKWVRVTGKLSSIVSIAPTHEPWHQTTELLGKTATVSSTTDTPSEQKPQTTTTRESITKTQIETECGAIIVTTGSGGTLVDSEGNPVLSGTSRADDPGIADAKGKGVTKACTPTEAANQPLPNNSVGTLTMPQTRALMAQLGKSESNFNYTAVNQYNYIGKYQFGAEALETLGYLIKGSSARGNSALNNPANWTGKYGLNSKDDFLNSPHIQELIMVDNLQWNYNRLVAVKGLYRDEGPCVVAGMLAVAHLLGAGGYDKNRKPVGAFKWRRFGGGSDANGTTGSTYFNRGRYAATVLAKNL